MATCSHRIECAIISNTEYKGGREDFRPVHRILGGSIMGNKKYVAYVGTYTHGSSKGIHVYDVDVEKGTLTERK